MKQKLIYVTEEEEIEEYDPNFKNISDLIPGMQNFVIWGLVVSKNAKEQLEEFEVVLSNGKEDIQITFWGKCYNKFFNIVNLHKCYKIENGLVKNLSKKDNNAKCPYEIAVSDATSIQEIENLPLKFNFNFTSFDKIDGLEEDELLDVQCKVSLKVKRHAANESVDRLLIKGIGNSDLYSCVVTIWKRHASQMASINAGDVVKIRNLRKKSFGDCSLCTCDSTFVSHDFTEKEKQDFEMEVGNQKKEIIRLTNLEYGV